MQSESAPQENPDWRTLELAGQIDQNTSQDGLWAIAGLSSQIESAAQSGSVAHVETVHHCVRILKQLVRPAFQEDVAKALLLACQYFHTVGRSALAISAGEGARTRAESIDSVPLSRRANSTLGGIYSHTENFLASLECLKRALEIARASGETIGEVSALNNCSATLTLMGLYREALCVVERVKAFAPDTPSTRVCQFASASNAIFCATRLGEFSIAKRSIAECEALLPDTPVAPLSRALFESHRSRYLVRTGRIGMAAQHVQLFANLLADDNPRISMLMRLSRALVEFESRNFDVAITRLEGLRKQAKASGLYYEDVLYELMRCYDATGSREQAISASEELANFTGDHKQVKFRRHLAALGVSQYSEVELASNWNAHHELRDPGYAGHSERTGNVAFGLATALHLPPAECRDIEFAARFHDIGLLGIPTSVLLTRNKLTGVEQDLLRRHTLIGQNILLGSYEPVIDLASDAARSHHERWDGNGYPDRTSGKAIPLVARITAVADAFDDQDSSLQRLGSGTRADAFAFIGSGSASLFDPQLVELLEPAIEIASNRIGTTKVPRLLELRKDVLELARQ